MARYIFVTGGVVSSFCLLYTSDAADEEDSVEEKAEDTPTIPENNN